MRKSRFTEDQIVGILQEHAAGEPIGPLCRRHGISQQTLYRWKQKYDGLEGQDVRRLKALEEENVRLKRLVAEQALDNQALSALGYQTPVEFAQATITAAAALPDDGLS